MITCAGCGWNNRDGAIYCAHCGAEISTAGTDSTKVTARAVQEVTELPSEGQPTAPLVDADAPGVEPLAPGSLLQQRFQIVQQLADDADARVFRAIDLERCAGCGTVGAGIEDGYCKACGASRATPCFVRITEQSRREPPPHDEHIALPDRDYYVTLERPARDRAKGARWATLRVGMLTHSGMQREINEDTVDGRIYERTGERRLALFVVADGLGGQDAGEVASTIAVRSLWQAIYDSLWAPAQLGNVPASPLTDILRAATSKADRAVAAARVERGNDMSSTLVVALMLDDALCLANVGDSRAYLLGRSGLQRLTHDHSLVQRLVDAGKLAPADVYTHPHRNVIYSSLGDTNPAEIEVVNARLTPGDRLLLCSDGLWEMVRDDGIEEVLLAEPDPQRACDLLVSRANLAGGEDNISVIVAQLEGASDA